MMISKEEVVHIVHLARLELSESELKKMQNDLATILEYIKILEKADVSQVEPTFSSLTTKNVFKDDQTEKAREKVIGSMLSQMPAKEGGYLKVKEILP